VSLSFVDGGLVLEEGQAPKPLWAALEQAGPLLVYKHSPICPVSARARRQVHAVAEQQPEFAIYEVDVVRDRETSLAIEERYQVKHESPQALLLSAGQITWHASHGAVTLDAILRELVSLDR